MFTQEEARAMELEDRAQERADTLVEEIALLLLHMREEDRAQDKIVSGGNGPQRF